MQSLALLLLAAAAASWVLVGAVLRYTLRVRLLDVPNERSSHLVATPRGGGAGFVAAFVLVVSLLMAQGLVPLPAGLAATLPGLAVALVGLVDDHRPVRVAVRLAVQTLAALLTLALVGTPSYDLFLGLLPPGPLAAVLTVVGLVWCMNLYNFMDGIDGIAAVEGITGFLFVAFVVGPPGLVFAVLAAVLAGFLPWNLPPARIFMGDVGSGFLGCQLGLAVVLSAHAAPRLVWLPLVLFALFIADATVTLLRRLVRGDAVHLPHRSHAYQHQAARWGHGRVTAAVALLNMAVLTPLALLASSSALAVLVALGGAALVVHRLGAGREAAPLARP